MARGVRSRRLRQLERAAYHEAGHCIAALALGQAISRATIDPDEAGRIAAGTEIDGFCVSQIDDDFPPDQMILVHLAGYASEWIRYERRPDCRDEVTTGCDLDSADDDAYRIATGVEPGAWEPADRKEEELAMAKADEIVEQSLEQARALLRERWAAVGRVAGALLQHRSLDGSMIRALAADEADSVAA